MKNPITYHSYSRPICNSTPDRVLFPIKRLACIRLVAHFAGVRNPVRGQNPITYHSYSSPIWNSTPDRVLLTIKRLVYICLVAHFLRVRNPVRGQNPILPSVLQPNLPPKMLFSFLKFRADVVLRDADSQFSVPGKNAQMHGCHHPLNLVGF